MQFIPSLSRVSSIACTLVVAASLTACSSDDDGGGGGGTIQPPTQSSVDGVISGITVNGPAATVELRTAAAPAGDASGAVITYAGGGTVAQGSTTQGQITSPDAFDALLVYVDGNSGYYEIDLDAEQTSLDLFLSLSADAPGGLIDCLLQGRRSGDSSFGEAVMVPLEVLEVGNGELQVNLSWNTDADLDIHVFEPSGNEIYWNNTISTTGGQLDLDANVGCGNVSVENIFWDQVPPVGQYRVAVENYTECSQTSSDFIITVTLPGQAPTLYTGSITQAEGLVEVASFDI